MAKRNRAVAGELAHHAPEQGTLKRRRRGGQPGDVDLADRFLSRSV
jgi:hypothetical protein